MEAIVFRIGAEYFGIEKNKLRGIMHAEEAIKVSNMHSAKIDGMLSLQNNIIPIVNLNEKLQIERLNVQGSTYYLIVALYNKMFAFLIDKPERYYDVPLEHLNPVPQILQSGKQQYFRWIAHIDNRLVFILDPEQLFEIGNRYNIN